MSANYFELGFAPEVEPFMLSCGFFSTDLFFFMPVSDVAAPVVPAFGAAFISIWVPDALSDVWFLLVVGVCAAAIDMPSAKAATAVRVVIVFIVEASLGELHAAAATL